MLTSYSKMTEEQRNVFQRFTDKILIDDGCWEWQGALGSGGYGLMEVGGKPRYVHRVSYEFFRGPIPSGMEVCHTCDNPRCVKPSHLFLGTQTDNIRDMVAKGRTARGEKHWKAKLTREQVKFIQKAYAAGTLDKRLAGLFGISRAHANLIGNGKTWKHLSEC